MVSIFDIVDSQVDKIMDKLVTLIEDRAHNIASLTPGNGNGTGGSFVLRVKLAKVPLPTFSGDHAEWPASKDLFLNMVRNSGEITDVENLKIKKH